MQVNSVNVSPETANHVLCSLNGVLQKPGSSFTVSSSSIIFASNLVTGDVIDFIQILGSTLDLGVPSDNVISTAKIVDGAVTAAKLASGAVANTPAFSVYLSGNVSLSNDTQTKLTFDSEEYDSGSVFASNKFTPGVVGKYVINAGASIDSDQNSNCDQVKLSIYKNGSALRVVEPDFRGNPGRRANPTFSYLINVTSTSDYFEIYAYHSAAISASGVFVQGGASYTYFNGYKIIE